MKNVVRSVVVLLALCTALSVGVIAQETAAPESAEVFSWKFQPPIGLGGRYTLFTRSKSSSYIPSLNTTRDRGATKRIDIENWKAVIMDYEVISRDLKGNTVSRLLYRDLKHSEARKIDGQSAPLSHPSRMPKLEKMFAGLQIDIKRTPEGQVLNILGLDSAQRRRDRIAAQHDAAGAALVKSLFEELCSEKSLHHFWDTADLRPETALRLGEGWDYRVPVELPMAKLSLYGTRKLSALDGKFAFVTDHGNSSLVSAKPLSPFGIAAVKLSEARVNMTGSGTLNGKTTIDRETGIETDAYLTHRWTASANLTMVGEGKILKRQMPQWHLWQSHRVFRADSQN